jgi:hypothetical protein
MAIQSVPSTTDEARERLQHAAATMKDVSDILWQLGALFGAIAKEKPNSAMQQLADLGRFVADDWANTVDLVREEVQEIHDKAPATLARAG